MSTIPAILDIWDFSNPEKSEQIFRDWIAKVPDSDSYQLELKTQVARTFSLRGKFDEAHAILDGIEPQKSVSPSVEVRYCLERGRTFNSANRQSEALPLFNQAWQIATEAKLDYLAVDAAHMLAIAEPDYEKQVEWNKRGLDYIEQSNQEDAKKWYGAIYNNLGWTYHDMGDYDNALAIFEKSLAWRESQGNLKTTRIAKYTLARTLRSLERFEEALAMQETLLADYQSTGDEDGFVSEEIGENLLALNRAEEAKTHFQEAYRLLKAISWVEKDRLERIRQLSK